MPREPVTAFCAGPTQFATTHWSVVLSARQADASETGAAALENLCRCYWYPLYAYLRRRGLPPDDAKDLTQGFFERLLSKQYLQGVDPGKGKFRSFLLAALDHFVANEWRHAHAQKRGGQAYVLSLEDAGSEHQYLQASGVGSSPAEFFDQQWAIALLGQVLCRLRSEFADAGKEGLFDQLQAFLTGEKRSLSYAVLARRQQTTPAALRMTVSRMRRRYGELLREEIARTVSRPEEVDEELHALFTALTV